MNSALKLAALDGVLSFLWTLTSSCLGAAAFAIAEYVEYEGDRAPVVYALSLVVTLMFGEVSFRSGGPAWNSLAPVVFYVAGVSKDTILTILMRIPAMTAGAAAGVMTATNLMPSPYRQLMGGPQLKADLYTGAMAEGFLTFAINLFVLYVVLRATKNRFLQTSMIVAGALVLVHHGGKYTGPGMSPSDAFAWAYLNSKYASAEHFIVYWLAPLVGGVAAALVYRAFFASPPPQAGKEKTA